MFEEIRANDYEFVVFSPHEDTELNRGTVSMEHWHSSLSAFTFDAFFPDICISNANWYKQHHFKKNRP